MKIIKELSDCKTCSFRILLFNDLSETEYDSINKLRAEKIYSRGEVIRHEGEDFHSFLYVRRGLVKLYKTDSNGKDHIISINKPGDFINLLSIFSSSKHNFSISALEETQVCEIELSALTKLIRENGNFALRVLNRISKISDEIIENNFQINKRQVSGRIALILVFFADKIYHSRTFRLPLTRKEIGQLISMTTENVIRTMSEFKKEGIIRIDNKTITILEYDQLINFEKVG